MKSVVGLCPMNTNRNHISSSFKYIQLFLSIDVIDRINVSINRKYCEQIHVT